MRTIEYLPLTELQADPRNPKAHDVGTITGSVSRFGIVDTIVRDDRTGYIVSGHGRAKTLRALQERGERPPEGVRTDDAGRWLVPVTTGWASRSDTEASAALVALNRTTELGGWVDTDLATILDELSAVEDGLLGVGFDESDLDELRDKLDQLDKPDVWNDRAFKPRPDPGEVERGQIWRVGDHLLACGDSRDPDTWERLLDGRKADLVFTDPPYGVNYDGGGVERELLEGDGSIEEAVELFEAVLDTVAASVRPGAVLYVTLGSGNAFPPMAGALYDRGLYRWMLVWVKNNATFGRSDYHAQHEPIVYGWWPGTHHPVADRTETTVWQIDRPSKSDTHPTEKPVDLITRAIENSTHPGAIVLDPFAGSASTLIAAHRTGRIGVACEWEPGYVSASLERLEAEIGETRSLVDNNDLI